MASCVVDLSKVNGQNSNGGGRHQSDMHGYAAEFPPLGETMAGASSHLVSGPTGIEPNFLYSRSSSSYKYAGSPSILQDSLVDHGQHPSGYQANVHKVAILSPLSDCTVGTSLMLDSGPMDITTNSLLPIYSCSSIVAAARPAYL